MTPAQLQDQAMAIHRVNRTRSEPYRSAEAEAVINGHTVRAKVVQNAGNRSSVPYIRWYVDGKRVTADKLAELTQEG